eukprot:1512025-Prymnesium_polylepis.1
MPVTSNGGSLAEHMSASRARQAFGSVPAEPSGPTPRRGRDCSARARTAASNRPSALPRTPRWPPSTTRRIIRSGSEAKWLIQRF